MKTSMTTLVAAFAIGSVGLVASNAVACHGGGYGGGYGHSVEYVRNVYAEAPSAPTFAPGHSMIVVMPGDSWFSICSREYGNSGVWSRVAEFNGMPQNLPLSIGMQLRLPVINPNGSLSISSAPVAFAPGAAQGFAGGMLQGLPQGAQFGGQNGMPQGQGFAPQQGQMGMQQGNMPQGGQFGPQGQQFAPQNGMPQSQPLGAQGSMPQGQGFAPQQGQMGMQQGNLPQGGQFGPQGQQFGQQGGMPQGQQFAPENGMPQGQPLGQGGLPQGPQAGPQGPMNLPQGEQIAPQAGGAAPQAETDPSQLGDIAAKVAQLAGQALAGSPVSNGAPGSSGQPGIENGPVAPMAPNANGNAAPAGRPLPSIVIGSMMSIGGQQLGNDRGMIHLTVNGQTRMLEVVEWNANGAKVKVPADLPAGAQAQLEIIRADGSTVTKDQVQLAAGQSLAAGN